MPTFVSIESPKLGSAVQLNNGDNTTVVSVENSTFGSVAQVNKNEIVNVYHLSNTDIQSYYNEISRQNAEDAQAAQLAAEVAQSAAETAETNAKASELDAEAAQVAAETAQSKAETAQSNAETARDASQTAQSLSETAQTGAELAEANAKASELDAEAAQVAAETAQSKAETAQSLSETAQAGAELAETNAETARDASQAAQAAAELAESNAKASELDAEAAATAAQTAQSLAETAQAGAELAETNAETAQSLSEAAQAAAEIAETNAEIAEVGSISARDESVTAQLAAEAARDAAQTARTGAETAEANAQASASGANSAKVAAQAAQANAETAQSAAETAEANAQASASSAAASAQSAATDADRAERAAETAVNTLSAKGDWDASQGVYPTPTPNSADFYQISVAGTMSGTQGSMEASVGDQLYWHVDKSVWYKIDNTDHILSVNGKEGTVVLDHTDVGALGATQNAVSASKWQSARTLTLDGDASGAASIDGSSNVTLTVDVANDSHTHDGRYHTKTEADSRFVNATGDSMSGELNVNAKVTATAFAHTNGSGTWMTFDGSILEGEHRYINNSAGDNLARFTHAGGTNNYEFTVYGRILENGYRVFSDAYHPNADKWTTARTLSLSGDVSGSVSWDGSANATLNATVDSRITWNIGSVNVNDDGARSVYFILADYESNGFNGKIISNRRSGNTFACNLDVHAVKTMTAGDNGSYYVRGSLAQDNLEMSIVRVTYDGGEKLALKIENVPQYHKPIRFSYYNANTSSDAIDVVCVTDDKITSETAVSVSQASHYRNWGFNSSTLTGTVAAPTFSGALSGNADTASKWLTARTLTLSGDASGSVSWDGSANATLAVTVANDSHTHDGRYYTESEADSRFMPKAGGQMDGALTIRHTNVQLNLMDSTYYDNYWQLDHQNGVLAFRYNGGDDDFHLNENGTAAFAHTVTAPTFSGALSGNASSATKLLNSRSLTVGHTTKSFNGTADVSWSANEITGTESSGQETFGSGELVTTDEFISLLSAKGAFSTYYWVCRGSWSYANQVRVDTGTGQIGTAGSVIEVIGTSTTTCTIRVTTPTTSSGGANSRREFIYINNGSSYSPGWRTAYNNHYHPEADKWSTARTLTLSGDLSGSVSIDGSSDVTLSASVANDSHTHNKLSPMNADWNSQTAEFRTGTTSAPAGSGLSSFVNWIQWGHNGGSKFRHTLYSFASSSMNELWYAYKTNTSDTTSAATKQRIYMDNYHPLADVATRANGVIVSSSSTSAWYDAVWHNNSNGLFSTPTVQIANSTGSIKSNRHYFAGTDYYLREATGAYGTVSTYGRKAGWGGYSIEGRVNFMHNGTDRCGLYNDVSNQWILESTLGAGLKLFYGSSQKLETTSSGVSVSGTLSASKMSVSPITSSNAASTYSIASQGAGVYAVLWSQSGQSNYSTILIWDGSTATLNGDYGNGLVPAINTSGTIYSAASTNWIPKRVVKIG